MDVAQLSKRSRLFLNQFVTYQVLYDEENQSFIILMNFVDDNQIYCEVKLYQTCGLLWTFETEELAWAFVHSRFEVNLSYILKGIYRQSRQLRGQGQDKRIITKCVDLYLRLATYLGEYKETTHIIDQDGYSVPIKPIYRITFAAHAVHGAENIGSYEYSFELKLYIIENGYYDGHFAVNQTFTNVIFTSKEIGKICDINLSPSQIVQALDSSDFCNLLKNFLISFDRPNLLEHEIAKVNAANKILSILRT